MCLSCSVFLIVRLPHHLYPPPVSSIILSINFILWRPLAFLPTTRPGKQSLFSPSLLKRWPKNYNCLLISVIRCLSTPALRKTTSFLTSSVHGILIILLKKHIFIALIHLFLFDIIVQVSHSYNNDDNTRHLKNLNSDLLVPF